MRLILPVVLLGCAVVAGARADTVGLRNDFCAIEFDRGTGVLKGIENVALKDQILKSKTTDRTPFRVYADFAKDWYLNDPEKAAQVKLGPEGLRLSDAVNRKTPEGEELRLVYDGGGFQCTLNVVLEEKSGESVWSLSVRNTGKARRMVQVEFPRFDGVQLGDASATNRETVLDMAGLIGDAWANNAGGVYGTADAHGKWSMQWHALFEPKSQSAFGLIVMDPEVRNKRLDLVKPNISVQYYPPHSLAPGKTLDLPAIKVLVYRGDWKHAARAYRKWFTGAFKLATPPKWFHECNSLEGKWLSKRSPKPPQFLGGWAGSGGTELMMQLDDYSGLPAAALLNPIDIIEYAYWERSAQLHDQCTNGDFQVRDDLGDVESLKKAFEKARQLGLRSILYVCPHLIHETSVLARTGKAKRWATVHHDGSMGGNYTQFGFHHPCPGCVEYQDYLAAAIGRLMKQTGANGVRLDAIGYYNYPCFNPAHRHKSPYDYNQWVGQMLAKVSKAALEANPDALLLTEGVIDYYAQWIHGGLTQFYPRDVPPMRLAVGPSYRVIAYSPIGPVWGSISGLAGGGRMPGADMNWRCASSPVLDTLTSGDLADEAPQTSDAKIIARRFVDARCDAVVAVRPAFEGDPWPLLQGISAQRARYEMKIPAGANPPQKIALCNVETLQWQSEKPVVRDGQIVVGTESNWLLAIVPHGNRRVVGFDALPEVKPGESVSIRPVVLAGQNDSGEVIVCAPGLQVGETGESQGTVRLGEATTIRVPGDAAPGWYKVSIQGDDVLGIRRMLHIISGDGK